MASTTVRPLAIALGGLLAMATAVGIGRFVLTPILPFMETSLDLAKPEAGLIPSANYLGYLLGALIAALGGQPGGRRGWSLLPGRCCSGRRYWAEPLWGSRQLDRSMPACSLAATHGAAWR